MKPNLFLFVFAGFGCLCPLQSEAQTFTLEECRTAALENNRTLQERRYEMEAATQLRKEAFTNYFPRITASGNVFQAQHGLVKADVTVKLPIDLPPQIPIQIPPMNLPLSFVKRGFMTSLTAVQPLFAGLKIVNGNKLARLGEEVGRLQIEKSEAEIKEQTDAYYWQVISLRDNLSTLDAVDKQLDEIYHQVQLAVDAGLTTRNDLLRVELKKQEIASARLKVENGIYVSKLLLSQFIGVDRHQFELAESSFGDVKNPAAFYIPVEDALDRRVEMQLTEKDVEAHKYQRRMESAKRLPTIGIGASYLYYNLTEKRQNEGMVFAQLSLPISEWWGGTHAVKRAKIKEKIAENRQQQATEMMTIEIEKSWLDLQEAYAQISIAERSVSSSAENLRQQRNFYGAGTSSMTDLLDAETLYIRSRHDYTASRAAYETALSRYMRTTGR